MLEKRVLFKNIKLRREGEGSHTDLERSWSKICWGILSYRADIRQNYFYIGFLSYSTFNTFEVLSAFISTRLTALRPFAAPLLSLAVASEGSEDDDDVCHPAKS